MDVNISWGTKIIWGSLILLIVTLLLIGSSSSASGHVLDPKEQGDPSCSPAP